MSKNKRTKIKDLLNSNDYDKIIHIKGWVRTKRGSKNIAFVAVNDGSIIHNIQVVVDISKFDDEVKRITTGACVGVTGKLVKSLGKDQHMEIQANDIEIYGTADSDQ